MIYLAERKLSAFDLFEDGLCDCPKGSLHLGVLLRVDLYEVESVFSGHLLALLVRDHSLSREIILVADQQYLHVRVAVELDLLQPVFYVQERLLSDLDK